MPDHRAAVEPPDSAGPSAVAATATPIAAATTAPATATITEARRTRSRRAGVAGRFRVPVNRIVAVALVTEPTTGPAMGRSRTSTAPTRTPARSANRRASAAAEGRRFGSGATQCW